MGRDAYARIGRFAGVGGLATAVHVGVALATEAAGLPGLLANLAGVLTAMLVSYFGHLHFTFGVRSAHAVQVPRFLLTSLSGLLVSSAIVAGVTAMGGSFLFAMALVVVVVPATTYLLLTLWVFNGRPHAGGAVETAAKDRG